MKDVKADGRAEPSSAGLAVAQAQALGLAATLQSNAEGFSSTGNNAMFQAKQQILAILWRSSMSATNRTCGSRKVAKHEATAADADLSSAVA
jgi:hypothetical protein